METRNGYQVYPLTVAQKFHLFYLPYCPNAAVLNIGTSLTIGTEVYFDVLREAIYKAYERNEGMRIRFTKDEDGTCYQYVVDSETDKKEWTIDYVDFSDKTMEEAAQIMQKWTTVPFKFEDLPMNKIIMIHTPDGFNGVYFLGHHMVVDAQSLIAFLKDIIEIYCNAKYEGVPYPKGVSAAHGTAYLFPERKWTGRCVDQQCHRQTCNIKRKEERWNKNSFVPVSHDFFKEHEIY